MTDSDKKMITRGIGAVVQLFALAFAVQYVLDDLTGIKLRYWTVWLLAWSVSVFLGWIRIVIWGRHP